MNTPRTKISPADDPLNWLDLVRQQVSSLQFGAVEIVVHDSRVVQIERTERVRLGHSDPGKGSKTPAVSVVTSTVPVSPANSQVLPSAGTA